MHKVSKKAYDFGRVFFPRKDDRTIPDHILFQPLGNHVSNVRKLVHYWRCNDFSKADVDESLMRVSKAAGLHDIGKPQRFGVSIKVQANGKFEFGYSFKGHRFLASEPKHPWVEALAKGHHDYSVHDICRDTYILKTLINKLEDTDPLQEEAEKYKHILESDLLSYARELYILEMCDQIEAEIACRFYEDKEQAESRAFMDFTITQADKGVFFLDPWIFDKEDDIEITLSSWLMPFPDEIRKALLKATKNDDATLTRKLQEAVEQWWQQQPRNLKSKRCKATIKRLPKDKKRTLNSLSVYQSVGHFAPYAMQEEMMHALDQEQNPHPAILLKAQTGTGKTEAILFPSLANDYRLILVLPTRSLLEDQRERIHKYLEKFSELEQNRDREISLVVDTGAEMDRWLYINGAAKKPKVRPRRHLYKGNIILTTLDKFLYRYFSFGDKQKSFIFPHRIHRENTLICFDEAHSYDDISFTNFQSLIRSLYEAGRSLVLMTATMPEQLKKEYFEYLQVIDHTSQAPNQPKRSFSWLEDIKCYQEVDGEKNFADFQNNVKQLTLEEWQSKANRRILTVVETVRDAAAIYQQLEQELGSSSDRTGRFLFLYHGRIADQLRPQLYQEIKQRDSNKQSYILVTTSAIEVGCDLNAEVLISQICPPENLIQRAGRCNRRGDVEDAKVIVVGHSIPEFANSLSKDGEEEYKKTLRQLNQFDAEAIASCISQKPHIDDYRVVELFSMLHDYVYSADLTCQPTHERGLIPTRSWEPSATLQFNGKDENTGQTVSHSISVPISRLAEKQGQQYAFTYAFERRYDKENTRWYESSIGWGSAYDKDIIIYISPDLNEFIFDSSLPSYGYDQNLGFVELPKIFSTKWIDGAEVKLKYEANKFDGSKNIAIISYTRSLDT